MMEVKVRLSLDVPGAKRLSWKECQKNPKESFDTTIVKGQILKGKGKRAKKENYVLKIHTRKNELIKQNINMPKEAYYYMLDTPYAQDKKVAFRNKLGVWEWKKGVSQEERVKLHCQLIADTLGAVSFSFKIMED